MDALNLCRFTDVDSTALAELSKSVGWTTTIETWRDLLRLGNGAVYGYRCRTGEIVASATILRYGSALASLGMVITKPSYQRRGLAKNLVSHVAHSSNGGTIALIATKEGLPLYSKIGFKVTGGVTRLAADSFSMKTSALTTRYKVEPFNKSDLEVVHALDSMTMGGARRDVLDLCLKRASRCCTLTEDKKIVGFGLGKHGLKTSQIGPIVAATADGAALLVKHLAANNNRRMVVDVPSARTKLLRTLISCGFTRESEASLMSLNPENLPGRREQLFAIASRVYL